MTTAELLEQLTASEAERDAAATRSKPATKLSRANVAQRIAGGLKKIRAARGDR